MRAGVAALLLTALLVAQPARARSCVESGEALGLRRCETVYGWSWSLENASNIRDAGAWQLELGYSRARLALPADGWLGALHAAGWMSAIATDRADVTTSGAELRVLRIAPSQLELGGALIVRHGVLVQAASTRSLEEMSFAAVVGYRLPFGRLSIRAEALLGVRLFGSPTPGARGGATDNGVAPLVQPRAVLELWPFTRCPLSAYVDGDPFGVRSLGFGVLVGVSSKSFAGAY